MQTSKPTLLSGIQPSGHLIIGNYLGAIRHWVDRQDDYTCLFPVKDMARALPATQTRRNCWEEWTSFSVAFAPAGETRFEKRRFSRPLPVNFIPVLMAADILAYDTVLVPVGDDQRQHLELARDLASAEEDFAGRGYGVLKQATAEAVNALLHPIQERYRELRSEPTYLQDTLKQGAETARNLAKPVLGRVQQAVGFVC